jgi:regulatory protein
LCIRSLTAGPRTRHELADLLRRRGVPDAPAQAVLDRFSAVGLIDDAGLAADFALTRQRQHGLSRRAIAHKLRQRGVSGETAAAAVADLDPAMEENTARALVARKIAAMQDLDPQARARRLVGMLARKGYPSGLSYRVVRDAVAELDLPTD